MIRAIQGKKAGDGEGLIDTKVNGIRVRVFPLYHIPNENGLTWLTAFS